MPTEPHPDKRYSADELLAYEADSGGVSFYIRCMNYPEKFRESFFKYFPETHTSYPPGGPLGRVSLLSEAGVDFDGGQAHEYRFSEEDGRSLHAIRAYFIGNYQYMLGVVSTPPEKVDEADVQRFFSSFKRR
jgi:hypothetical protein